jgi:YgiT-type zinc finger domain-containing protein
MEEWTVAHDGLEAHWQELIEDVLTGMQDWRTAHPQASFAEIESAVDERLAGVRARMLEAAALASRAADVGALAEAERPRCPECGQPLVERGRHTRTLTAAGDQAVHLERSYAVCPSCGTGLFPPG